MSKIDLTLLLPNTFFSSTFTKINDDKVSGIYNSDCYLRINLLENFKYYKYYYWIIINEWKRENSHFQIIAKYKSKLKAEIFISILYQFSILRFKDSFIHYVRARTNSKIYLGLNQYHRSLKTSINTNRFIIKKFNMSKNDINNGLNIKPDNLIDNNEIKNKINELKQHVIDFWINYNKYNNFNVYGIIDRKTKSKRILYEYKLNDKIIDSEMYNEINKYTCLMKYNQYHYKYLLQYIYDHILYTKDNNINILKEYNILRIKHNFNFSKLKLLIEKKTNNYKTLKIFENLYNMFYITNK